MSAKSLAIRQKQIVVRTVAYVLGFVAFLIGYRHAPELGRGWLDAYEAIPMIVAAKWSFRLVRRFIDDDHFNISCFGYVLLASGSLSAGIGRLLTAFYKLGLHQLPPMPGIPDHFFVTADAFVISGAFLLIVSLLKAGIPRLLLETSIPAGSAGLLDWHFIASKEIALRGLDNPVTILSLEYQICNLVILWLSLSLAWMKLPEGRSKRCLPAIAFGLGIRVVARSLMSPAILYHNVALSDFAVVIISLGWLIFGFAAALQLWFGYDHGILPVRRSSSVESSEIADDNTSLVLILSPYIVASLAGGAMMANDYCRLGAVRPETFAVTYIVIALIVFRQVFTLIENRILVHKMDENNLEKTKLAERIRSFSDGLEEVVEQRAQQLGALHQLTKAVHTTQQVDEVLEAATKHTAKAMRSLTAAIWLREEKPSEDAPAYCLSCIDANYTSDEMMRFVQCYIPKTRDDAYTVEISGGRGTENMDLDDPYEGSVSAGEMLCAPMRFRNEILGVIAVGREVHMDGLHNGSDAGDAFDQSDHDLLESIGIEVATALHHARQFAAAVDAADHDPVTNLFNHRAIHERLDEELALANAESLPLSVMMMDLNDFKLFNDTYGHPVGDQVLRLVAQGIREENPDAIAARYGGDEFLVLAPRTTSAQARDFAERLRQRLISEGFQNPLAESGQSIPIAISFGVAMFPEDSTNRTDLLSQADSNLYKAKNSDTGIGLTNASQRVNKRLKTESSFGILDAMVTSVDNKDKYTRQHSEDVCKYALWLAQELRLSDESMRLIRIGAMLHDVGKIGVPAEILRKPGHLTEEEYEAIKQHPSLGAMIVGAVPGMEGIVDAVRFHHERWDGKGYPDKLTGTDIPMIGRIMAVADAFSAMTTNRTYRAGMEWAKAISEIAKGAGTQFDPLMARAFCNVVRWRLTVEGKAGDLDEIDFEDNLPLAA